jgi:hypothetical protein
MYWYLHKVYTGTRECTLMVKEMVVRLRLSGGYALKFDRQAKAVGCGARSDRYIHGHAGASHQAKVGRRWRRVSISCNGVRPLDDETDASEDDM